MRGRLSGLLGAPLSPQRLLLGSFGSCVLEPAACGLCACGSPPRFCPHCRLLSFFQELISQMLQVNVEARCTAGQILSHPWVSVSTHVPGTDASVSRGPQRAPSPGLRCRPRSGPTFCGALGVLFHGHAACPLGAAAGTRPLCEGPARPVSAGRSVLTCEVLSKDLFPPSWGLRVLSTCPEMSLCGSRTSVFLARGHRSAPAPGGGGREPGGGCVKFGECPTVGSASGLGSNTVHARRAWVPSILGAWRPWH